MRMVTNLSGTKVDYEAAIMLMDDDLMAQISETMDIEDCDSEQVFFTLYEMAHHEKFGEWWELSKENPVY